ncbi:MAG: sn-glycerol-3-phosphate ABC transporter ATP-binding protein UgpC [Acidimicrobiales bacterium]|jgi:multiple sugar transport system ATP-binding protein
MASITLEKVTKVYPNGFEAIHELDLDVADGEFMVIVGPSGCGKTTALRMVAGLEDITDGTVRIGDRIVNDLSPKDRDIAMVFQNYALYPHMTVGQNIGFALKLRKMPKAEIKKKVNVTAEILGLTEWLNRKPGQLSGGQRQRVAMGRAIVREPSVFLMDEPLSNLDAKLRVQMRGEVARIQRSLGVATLYVTHDQVEAMTMGDRVAVIRDGVLQQCDNPQALYDNPKNLFVAGFMGSPAMNLFEATIGEGASSVLIGSQRIELPATVQAAKPALRAYANRSVVVGIRPENLPLLDTDGGVADAGSTAFEGDVELVEALGSELLVHFSVDARRVVAEGTNNIDAEGINEGALAKSGEAVARVEPRMRLAIGSRARFLLDSSWLHFFDTTSNEAIVG